MYATYTGRQAGPVRLSSGMASVATDLALFVKVKTWRYLVKVETIIIMLCMCR